MPEITVFTGTPGQPTSLSVCNTTLHTTTLMWLEPQGEVDRPVTEYVLMIYKMGGTGHGEVLTETHRMASDCTEFIIKDLNPQEAYIFRLAAKNNSGLGPCVSCKYPSLILRSSYITGV